MHRRLARRDEGRALNEILGRVAGNEQLRQDDEVRARAAGIPGEAQRQIAVAGDVADRRVGLRQRDGEA